MQKRVAVVGAGLAGLAAAWSLSESGSSVTVFESRSLPGGRMRTDDLDGVKIDTGVQLLGSTYQRTFALARAAGISDRVKRSPGRDAVWRKGRAHPLTYGSVASMITSSALPATLKLRLGAQYLPYLTRHAARLDLHDLLNTGGLEHDRASIAAWGMAELGEDFVEYMAYPLLGAYYGSSPEDTSAAIYHALARIGMDVTVHAIAGGMALLPHQIARALQERGAAMRYDHAISGIELRADDVLVHHQNVESFDAVIVATPPPVAAQLVGDGAIAEWLGGVRMQPTVTLALALRESLHADFFGLSIPRISELKEMVALCVQERKVSGLVEAGRGALIVLPAPAHAAGFMQMQPEQVLDALLPRIEAAFPRIRDHITRARTTSFEHGYTVFYAGYLKHLAAFRAIEMPGRLALAGDYLVAPTVEGAVRSGEQAARRITQFLAVRE